MTPQERIVEQALRLFVTQGIKSVRMEDLARLAGVSKRVLYDMFEDKENLLYRVMLRYFEQNREHWRQQSAGAGNVLEELFMVLGDICLLYTSDAADELVLPSGISEREAFVQIISTFFRGIATPKGLQCVDEYLARYEPGRIRR